METRALPLPHFNTRDMSNDTFKALAEFELGNGKKGKLFSLPALEKQGVGPISKLPNSIRIVLESGSAIATERK